MNLGELKTIVNDIKEDNTIIHDIIVYEYEGKQSIVVVSNMKSWSLDANSFNSYEQVIARYMRKELYGKITTESILNGSYKQSNEIELK